MALIFKNIFNQKALYLYSILISLHIYCSHFVRNVHISFVKYMSFLTLEIMKRKTVVYRLYNNTVQYSIELQVFEPLIIYKH